MYVLEEVEIFLGEWEFGIVFGLDEMKEKLFFCEVGK